MSDSTISAVPPTPPQQTPAAPVIVKVDSIPPEILLNMITSGEVIAKENQQTTIKTNLGPVVIDAEIPIEIGQKINFKLQTIIQNANATLVAELLNLPKEKLPAIDQLQKPVPVTQIPTDPVVAFDADPVEPYRPLQALVMQMPDVLTDETVTLMVKSLLKLPLQQPLPPSLMEGFDKFKQLAQLVGQANLLPTQSLQTAPTAPDSQQNIITILQQLLNPGQTKQAQPNPLLTQMPQNFLQLQTILPGQNLSPNILVDIKNQLIALLQPSAQQPMTAQPVGQVIAQQATPKPSLFTMPTIALVLGAQPSAMPQMKDANLVFMTTPQGDQLIGLLNTQRKGDTQKPLLPGSVFVAAFQPQAQKNVAFPVMPTILMPQIVETFLPLHPSLGDTWPLLDEVWDQALAQQTTNPEIMASLRQVIPTPTSSHMPPAMLFFLSILKNGNAAQWINEKQINALEKVDKAALLTALTQDMQAIKTRMEDNAPADSWRPLPMPIQMGDQLMRLQWFYRHPEQEFRGSDDNETATKKQKTRFLLNVPKTNLGDIQIDGLVQEKTLDIVLRTEQALSSEAERAILGRYTSALEISGFFGSLNFQNGKQHYVHV